MKYGDPTKGERRRRSRRWNAGAAVVVNAVDGLGDEVARKAMAAELVRIATRRWLMTQFDFNIQRPKTPAPVKTAAWRQQGGQGGFQGTVGCWFDQVACNEEVKAACRVNCRGREAHLLKKEVQFAHLWALWHQMREGLWGKVRGVRFVQFAFCAWCSSACILSGSTV